jgi:signal transduction histidine kinase
MFHQTTSLIPPKHEHRLLGMILITLHIILWWDFSTLPLSEERWIRAILLIHIGFFVLWHPLWNRLYQHRFRENVLLGIVIAAIIVFPNVWLIAFWQIILLGFMGGRDLVKPVDRFVNIAAILFLSLELFIVSFHQLFLVEELILLYQFAPDFLLWPKYLLLSVPLMFLFITTDDSQEHRYHVDFFHGLTVSMFILIMALGSLTMMSQYEIIMPVAIFQVSLGLIVFILIVSWFWIIYAGEEGVNPLWTRHLYNIGNTFEQWLEHLAQPSNYKNLTCQEFLHTGFEQLITLPWISGIAWHSLYGEEMLGHQDKEKVVITVQSLEVTVYAHYRISGTQYFQIKILIQLLEHFHQAKRREAAFAQQAHLQAIHETGAKLTHDIKNLLQSLHAITSVIETYPSTKFGDTQRLLQGQMPHLTQRLKRTLDKLQKPAEFSYSHVPVSLWWDNIKARYRKSKIEFSSHLESENILIPEDLFDNVSENLLQNALMKRKREPDLQIKVVLHIDKRRLQLTVCDDGTPIPKEITNLLLTQPVQSRDGFGIGLYQAVKQLAHTGYVLNIIENVEGQVCFELASTE